MLWPTVEATRFPPVQLTGICARRPIPSLLPSVTRQTTQQDFRLWRRLCHTRRNAKRQLTVQQRRTNDFHAVPLKSRGIIDLGIRSARFLEETLDLGAGVKANTMRPGC